MSELNGNSEWSAIRARRPLFGALVSPVTEEGLIRELVAPAERGSGARLVVTMNLDHVVKLRLNDRFRRAYQSAWRVTIDGAPVFAYARLVGVQVPERITGADLYERFVDSLDPGMHRLFFVVSSSRVATCTAGLLQAHGFDPKALAFDVPPLGFQDDVEYSNDLAERIQAFSATHLILAVGAPKSEIWASENSKRLGDLYILCIGAAVEFVAGLKRRSPRWMRRAGLEWVWRVASEPRRLARRYFIDSFGFLRAIAADRRSDGERVH